MRGRLAVEPSRQAVSDNTATRLRHNEVRPLTGSVQRSLRPFSRLLAGDPFAGGMQRSYAIGVSLIRGTDKEVGGRAAAWSARRGIRQSGPSPTILRRQIPSRRASGGIRRHSVISRDDRLVHEMDDPPLRLLQLLQPRHQPSQA